MKTVKNHIDMENMNFPEVKSIEFTSHKGKPGMAVKSNNNTYLFPLETSFQIHRSNELLRSLKPGFDIFFESFRQYEQQIKKCNIKLVEGC